MGYFTYQYGKLNSHNFCTMPGYIVYRIVVITVPMNRWTPPRGVCVCACVGSHTLLCFLPRNHSPRGDSGCVQAGM